MALAGGKPLQEAIFEVHPTHCRGWSELSYDRLAAAAGQRYSGAKEVLGQMGVQMVLGPDAKSPPVINTEPARHRVWMPDRGEMFQFSPTVGAYNVMGHYTHFVDHAPEMRRLFAAYIEEARPVAFGVVGQRYINKFLLTQDEHPERYFQFYPRLPPSDVHRAFALQVATEAFKDGQVIVTLTYRGDEEQSAVYFLDIFAQGATEAVDVSADSVMAWQERAHEAVRRAFMLALTEAALQRWWGDN